MIPTHVAIIMDGNGRWAREQAHERTFGHEQGVNALEEVVDECISSSIKFLTVYAFSTENWSRPATEVSFLLELLKTTIVRVRDVYRNKNVRVQFCGERAAPVPQDVLSAMEGLEQDTAQCTELVLTVCFNYGGKAEIVHAVKKVLSTCLSGDAAANITRLLQMPTEDFVSHFEAHLYTNLPPVDLLIRTGCEKRLSNFFPWQTTYAELIFKDVLWPEFTTSMFKGCLREYASRSRRFGRTD